MEFYPLLDYFRGARIDMNLTYAGNAIFDFFNGIRGANQKGTLTKLGLVLIFQAQLEESNQLSLAKFNCLFLVFFVLFSKQFNYTSMTTSASFNSSQK